MLVPFAGLALLAHAAAGFALLGRHFVLAAVLVVLAQAASLALLRPRHEIDTVGHRRPEVIVPEGRAARAARPILAGSRCAGRARIRRATPPQPRRKPAPRRATGCGPRVWH